MSEYVPHITFYEEETETLVSFVDHPSPPRVGEKVWLWGHRTREQACWEVVAVAWDYGAELPNRAKGGRVDVMVRPSEGLFKR